MGSQHLCIRLQAPIQNPRSYGIPRDGVEHQSLLAEKGANPLLPSEAMGWEFYSTSFLMAKKDEVFRPTLNLQRISLSCFLLSVRLGDWFTTGNLYKGNVTPRFSLLTCPHTFIKCMDVTLYEINTILLLAHIIYLINTHLLILMKGVNILYLVDYSLLLIFLTTYELQMYGQHCSQEQNILKI